MGAGGRSECPTLAKSRPPAARNRLPLIPHLWTAPCWQGIYERYCMLVGAAICPAFGCGTLRWPLAIMLSADQVPISFTQSRGCKG